MPGILDGLTFFCINGWLSVDSRIRHYDPYPPMTYIIAEPCVDLKDASCVEVCPVDCIYEGEDMYYIHPVECIDCGACEPECPVTAIFPDTDVPPEWSSYIAKNADFFDDV
jgi:ferredoxin